MPCEFTKINTIKNGFGTLEKDGQVGLINSEGILVLPCEYDEIGGFNNGYVLLEKSGKLGLLNDKVELLLPCEYSRIDNFINGRAKVQRADTRKFGVIDTKGNLVIPCEYSAIYFCDNGNFIVCNGEDLIDNNELKLLVDNNIAREVLGAVVNNIMNDIIEKKGLGGFVDNNVVGDFVTNIIYNSISDIVNNDVLFALINSKILGVVADDSLKGLMDKDGKALLECKYNEIYDFRNSFMRVGLNGKKALVNDKGNFITEFIFDDIVGFIYDDKDSTLKGAIEALNDGKILYLNKKGEILNVSQ